MNTSDGDNKIVFRKRPIKSFEADKEVAEMLQMAQEDGLTVGEICNRALRKHGTAIIQEIISEHNRRRQRWAVNSSARPNVPPNVRGVAPSKAPAKPPVPKAHQRKVP